MQVYQNRTVLVSKMNYEPAIPLLTNCKSLGLYSGMCLIDYRLEFSHVYTSRYLYTGWFF